MPPAALSTFPAWSVSDFVYFAYGNISSKPLLGHNGARLLILARFNVSVLTCEAKSMKSIKSRSRHVLGDLPNKVDRLGGGQRGF
jgi:hypothetical protein